MLVFTVVCYGCVNDCPIMIVYAVVELMVIFMVVFMVVFMNRNRRTCCVCVFCLWAIDARIESASLRCPGRPFCVYAVLIDFT